MWFLVGIKQRPQREVVILPADSGGVKSQALSLISLTYLSDFSFSSEFHARAFYEENKAEIKEFHEIDEVRLLNLQVIKTSWSLL